MEIVLLSSEEENSIWAKQQLHLIDLGMASRLLLQSKDVGICVAHLESKYFFQVTRS